MHDFINIYRNPIFGILMLLCIVIIIAFADSLKAKRNRKKKRDSLNNLSKNFQNTDISQNLKSFMSYAKNPTPMLLLVAKTYSKAGNHEQAIAIYKILNEYSNNVNEKIEILESLGESYYKAGFLERSKSIFAEILQHYPYNMAILEHYMRTCENLKQYKEALEALNCINEIYNNQSYIAHEYNKIIQTRNYLKTMQVISDHRIDLLTQQEKLLEIYEKDKNLRNLILRHFKLYNTGLFWQKILEIEEIYPYTDILWHFQKHEIPFDSIVQHPQLLNIYRAKGFLGKEYSQIECFPLEVLQLLHLYSYTKGNLEFTYRCKICNGTSPFYSYRCSICAEINSIELIMKPVQEINLL
ncbi:hypothetical protein CQA53_00125 [Helicobacter didelphidarum]|uniref:Uncharacterized protein n=1 Tax=Helicobacter didelphidarum TaxID=2040648 RepID=A0A3D8IRE2_9HELI|nr:hypothetical protein [Helicobacter didelphidarum]RDU67475.1 hypothetical protein CQA53_00125 [Helicobacter didelphidarum]